MITFHRAIKTLVVLALAGFCCLSGAQQGVALLPTPVNSDAFSKSVKVVVPEDYKIYPNRKYITIYLLDSQSDSFFECIRSSIKYLVDYGYMDPVILVGISSMNRQYDFTPEPLTQTGKTEFKKSGGAELYYRYISQTVVPAVEHKYRCEPFRIGIGHSLGGTFLIDCLLKHQELFNANIVISPNLVFDGEQLLHSAKDGRLAEAATNRFLYLANGHGDKTEEKFRATTMKFAELSKAQKSAGFHFLYDPLNNTSHGTTALEGIPKGLVSLYSNIIYPDAQYMKRISGDQEALLGDVSKFYQAGSKWTGLKLPLIPDINLMGYNCHYLGHDDTAIRIFRRGISVYPDDFNLYDSLGEIEQLSGNIAAARQYYTRGLEIVETQKAALDTETYASLLAGFRSRLQSLVKKSP